MGIELMKPQHPNLSPQAKKEFLRADAIADRFERILSQLKALARMAQQRYEDNANTRRSESMLFQKRDKVMVSLENMKTNRPKKKWDNKWDGLYKVLEAYRGAVVVDLPNHIHVNKSFHTSKVRLWSEEEIPGQADLNEAERRNIAERIVERDDEGNIEKKWEFEKILDVHNEDKQGLTYLIKWKYHEEPTWQPEQDLKGNEREICAYYKQHPHKLEPPAWAKAKDTSAQAPRRRRGRPSKAR